MTPSTSWTPAGLVGAFLVCAGLFLLTSGGRARVIDEYMVYFQTESLARRGDLTVPQAERVGAWYGRADRQGRPRAPYGPAHPPLLVPGYALGSALGQLQEPGLPRDLLRVYGVSVMSSLLAALLVAFFLGFCNELGASRRVSLAAAAGLALATPLWSSSGTLFSESTAALLLLASAFTLHAARQGTPGSLLPFAASGTLLGLAVLIRPTHVIAAPVMVAALGLGRPRSPRAGREIAALGAALAALVVALLIRNAWLFGDPFEFGYPDRAEGGKELNTFDTPFGEGLLGFLFSPGKSLLLFAPLLLLSLWPVVGAARRREPLAIIGLGGVLIYLVFYSTYTQWEGGYCYGPRYLFPVIPLLLLGLVPALSDHRRRYRWFVFAALALVGVMVQIPGVFTSFLEAQVAGAAYYDEAFRYRWSHNPWAEQGALMARYLAEAAQGRLLASPLGQGIDVWWVYLSKGGVSAPWIGLLALIQLGLVAGGARLLIADLRDRNRPKSDLRVEAPDTEPTPAPPVVAAPTP